MGHRSACWTGFVTVMGGVALSACGAATGPGELEVADDSGSLSRPTLDGATGADAGPPEASSPPAVEAAAPPMVCEGDDTSCTAARRCLQNLVYGQDTGRFVSGVWLFSRERDVLAYLESLGDQEGTSATTFVAGGKSYALAWLKDLNVWIVADARLAPGVYAAIVRYDACALDGGA